MGIAWAMLTAAAGALGAFLAASEHRRPPAPRPAAAWFWTALGAYMALFALLRLNHLAGLPFMTWFYLSTVGGAASVVFLTYILIGVIFPRAARAAAAAATVAAVAILTLLFSTGVEVHEGIDLQFVPVSALARMSIAAVYLVLPVAMTAVSLYVTRDTDAAFRRRTVLFAAAAMLVYLPNAIRYVALVPEPVVWTFAPLMALGAWLGWQSARSV